VSKGKDPAFPRTPANFRDRHGTAMVANPASGLTKREFMATMLLQGILASGGGGEKDKKIAAAIDYADFLLADLEESK
jgi:hypothetical protein